MIERKTTRRKGGALDSPIADRRRPKFERRGTVLAAAPPSREVLLYGDRRLLPDAGLE